MKNFYIISIMLIAFSSCSENNSTPYNQSSDLRILYSVPYGSEYESITSLGRIFSSNSFDRDYFISENFDFISFNNGNVSIISPNCNVKHMDDDIAICQSGIWLPKNDTFNEFPNMERIVSVAKGLNNRLIYLLTSQGNIEVYDSNSSSQPNDDGLLFLYSIGKRQIEFISGNIKKSFYKKELDSPLYAYTTHNGYIFLLYGKPDTDDPSISNFTLEKMDLADFSVVHQSRFYISSDRIPNSIAAGNNSKVVITFENNTNPLMINLNSSQLTELDIDINPEKVIFLNDTSNYYFFNSSSLNIVEMENSDNNIVLKKIN